MKNKIFAYKYNNTIFHDKGFDVTEEFSTKKNYMYTNSTNCNMIKSLNSDEQKLKYLELFKNKLGDFERACIIASLENDEIKMDLVKDFSDEKKVAVIISLDSTEKKKELMEGLPDELKEPVIISFSSDEEKLKYIKEENGDMVNSKIIESLESDELKKEYLENNNQLFKELFLYAGDIVSSMDSEEYKKEYINQHYDFYLENIVKSLQNDEDKMEYYDYYVENFGPKMAKELFVECLNSDEKKEEFLNSQDEVKLKSLIIMSMQSDDRKIEFLDEKLLEINANKEREDKSENEKQKDVENNLEEYTIEELEEINSGLDYEINELKRKKLIDSIQQKIKEKQNLQREIEEKSVDDKNIGE